MSTKPTQPDFARLYRPTFAEYGARALWDKRFLEHPTQEDALALAHALRDSDDIDVFHDREERVAAAALHDVNVLEAAGRPS